MFAINFFNKWRRKRFVVDNPRVSDETCDEEFTVIRTDAVPFNTARTTSIGSVAEEVFEIDRRDAVFFDRVEQPASAYNERALLKTALTYELEKFKKNAMIIFNHIKVDGYPELRLGTTKDQVTLCDTFKEFNFEIFPFPDLTKTELFNELGNCKCIMHLLLKLVDSEPPIDILINESPCPVMRRDFTEYGCVVVVVLTHGSHNGVLRAKDREYKEIEILNYFRTHDKPTLVTKPKILLVQACRGTNNLRGVPVRFGSAGTLRMDSINENESYFLPVEADMLVFHSTFFGSPSVRDIVDGSWFIQTLCKNIKKHSNELDFESIAMQVRREIAIDMGHRERNPLTHQAEVVKQMPVMTSSLIRKLYLVKYGGSLNLRKGEPRSQSCWKCWKP